MAMSTTIIAIERTGMDTLGLANWEEGSLRDDAGGTRRLHGHIQVCGIGTDGTRHALCAYYSDEIAFTEAEWQALVGAEVEEARRLAGELRLRRDVAFLRSP